MPDFSGRWHTTFGPMELRQTGKTVDGAYFPQGITCPLKGQVSGSRLTFRYQEPNVGGDGWFDLSPNGNAFRGEWRADGDTTWRAWTGNRVGFDGLWLTDFGHMRLVEDGNRVHGTYELHGGSTITGQRSGNTLTFTYEEPDARGKGQFVLAADGLSFAGQWQPVGGAGMGAWKGQRLGPTGLTWLVVFEVPWHGIADARDYSFGGMLREFFSRYPGVRTRVRFFSNEAALLALCQELWYVPDPVVLVVATHSKEHGIQLGGKTVLPAAFEEGLRYVPDLRLLHFSACLLMKEPALVEGWRRLANRLGTSVSGYATSVNWAASAIIEFTYLELMFAQNLTAARAAEEVVKLLTFAGAGTPPGSVLPAADMRFVGPDQGGS
jgi:hypothetical protein